MTPLLTTTAAAPLAHMSMIGFGIASGLGSEIASVLGVGGLGAAELRLILLQVLCTIAAIAVHEFAHAFAASQLGDRTAEAQGRLTLNPISHIDPIGTILLPIAFALSWPGHSFGWGRPVPFNAVRFTRKVSMRLGTAIVSFAGPLSNLLLAALTLVGAFGLAQAGVLAGQPGLYWLLQFFFVLNLGLFAFNMIPLHPLDGGKILSWILGPRFDPIDAFLAKWGGFILLGLVLSPVPILEYLLRPIVDVGLALLHAVVV